MQTQERQQNCLVDFLSLIFSGLTHYEQITKVSESISGCQTNDFSEKPGFFSESISGCLTNDFSEKLW
jgi:hypothetical protein